MIAAPTDDSVTESNVGVAMEAVLVPPPPARRLLSWGWTTVLAAVLFIAVAAFIMAPALQSCSTTIMGQQPGDASGGGVWAAYNYEHAASPFTSTTDLAGAPGGGPLFIPIMYSQVVWRVPLWAFAHVVNGVCAWNLDVLMSLVADGLAMYAMAGWITRRRLVAVVAGYAYAFLPFHVAKTLDHIGYVDSWPLPVLVLALLMMVHRPTRRRALLAAAAVGLCWYTDGYYALFSAIIVVTIIGVVVATILVDRRRGRRLSAYLRAVAVMGLGTLLVLLPLAFVYRANRSAIASTTTRSAADVAMFSARPTDYLFPSELHPLFGAWATAHRIPHSNLSEEMLYLGVTLMLLAGVACVLALRGRLRHPASGLRPGSTAVAMVVLAAVAFVVSLPPRFHGVPMPSGLIFHFVPFWRVYARLVLVVAIGVIVLAALALDRLPRGRRGDILVCCALPIIAFDFLSGPNNVSFSYASTRDINPVYRQLAAEPGNGIVAGFPLGGDPSGQLSSYLTYAYVFRKPLLNGAAPGSRDAEIRAAAYDIQEPQSVPILRYYHVTWVVLDESLYFTGKPSTDFHHIDGLQEIASSGGVHLYRLLPGPVATVAVAPGEGIDDEQFAVGQTFRWMGYDARLDLTSLDGRVSGADVALTMMATLGPRQVTMTQSGRVVWRGTIPSDAPAVVRLHVPDDDPITISADHRQPETWDRLVLDIQRIAAD